MKKRTKRLRTVLGSAAITTAMLASLGSPAAASVEPEDGGGNICINGVCTRDTATGRKGAIGDFDGNGQADGFRVVSDPNGSNNLLQVRYNNAGSWKTVNKTGAVRSQLRLADFNGDNKDDVFVKWPSGRWAYLSAGKGSWKTLSKSSHPIDRLRFKDIDGDGKDDVLGAYPASGPGLNGQDFDGYKYYYVPTSGPGTWRQIPAEFN